jgi:hypothetical protein
MPPVSQAQRGIMHATLEGAHTGIPMSVAREFVNADQPGKLPQHVPHHAWGGLIAACEPTFGKHADGGGVGLAGATHLQTGGLGSDSSFLNFMQRAQARQEVDVPYGFLNSGVAGRTDRIPASVAADSFVIPAAEVSGLGQGNSLAGSHLWSLALGGIGPHGVKPPPEARGPGPPSHHPPPVPGEVTREMFGYASGGREPRKASVLLAGGEMVIPPWKVQKIGDGDMQEGHRRMREAVKRVREHVKRADRTRPGPKE